eukprot:gene10937-12098_t
MAVSSSYKNVRVKGEGFFHQKDNPLSGVTLQTSPEELATKYDRWSENYDNDMGKMKFSAPAACLAGLLEFADAYGVNKDSKIIDVGAGTGALGLLLKAEGFTNVDALDGAKQMIEASTKKNCYNKLIHAFIGASDGPEALMEGNAYKVVFCVACFSLGHMQPKHLDDLVKMVQHGGLLIFTVRRDADEKFGFKKKIDEMVSANTLQIIDKKLIDYFPCLDDSDAARYCYRYICERKSPAIIKRQ